ncbi:hypothetical protein K1719_036608 [Acacia pycnantha]|nr:hypothetical protein K1719_036608 [Acacia pycnantha]
MRVSKGSGKSEKDAATGHSRRTCNFSLKSENNMIRSLFHEVLNGMNRKKGKNKREQQFHKGKNYIENNALAT